MNPFAAISALIYPPICPGCEQDLFYPERHLCTTCRANLPYIKSGAELVSIQERYFGKFKDATIIPLLKYHKKGLGPKITTAIKYHGSIKLGLFMGELFAIHRGADLQIELLCPVPVHKKRQRKRGYNQSELIAKGFAKQVNIPLVSHAIKRTRLNVSQVGGKRNDRWENVSDSFQVMNVGIVKGKNVGLIDDVLTTGATAAACIDCLLDAGAQSITLLPLAVNCD